MRQRISKLIGPDAQKVAVHTFHGLGSEIINRYPEYFYQGADMQPSDEVMQTEIIEKILQKLPHDNPLTKGIGSEFSQLNSIRSALDSIKKAGLNPGELRQIIVRIKCPVRWDWADDLPAAKYEIKCWLYRIIAR